MKPRRNQIHVDFVQTELLLARTFCRLAETDFSGRSRCIQYARTAYDSATRFMLKARMDDAEFATFSADLEGVKFVLEALELESR